MMTAKEAKAHAERCHAAYKRLGRHCKGCAQDAYCPLFATEEASREPISAERTGEMERWEKTYWIRFAKWHFPIKLSVCREPFNCSPSGLWPLGIKFWAWGVGFHWRTIADAYVRIGWYR